nr:TonB-dependent receptor [Saprospiraceae bacterium]
MNQTLTKQLFLLLSLIVLTSNFAFSQGVTTSTMSGTISSESGDGLAGAVVKAVHLPSGTNYSTLTNESGRYTLPNLRVGGPYTVTVTYIGFEDFETNDLQLSLGQNFRFSPELVEEGNQLEAVEVVVDPILNGDRTGAATNISSQQLQELPSISRSAQDFTRLTPSAAGNSFAGRNNQFNNFSLDGSIFNNPFGLDAATPGGQTEAQAVSLDAIDQIQVAIAPYDVTQAGFTGASVNAVTKSGTNDFHGTVFYFTRNEDLTGGKVNGTDIFVPDLTQQQFGASLGGPIIKNKLFFFANYERDEREDLAQSFFPADNASQIGEGNISRILRDDFLAVQNALAGLGYDAGPFEGYTHDTPSDKWITKLDFNVNDKHTITATYNGLNASKQKPAHPFALGRRGPDANTLQFQNAGYEINNQIQSGIIEWRGSFGNKFANKFQAGYTHFDDFRNPLSSPAPVININQNGSRYIVAGHEPFSINNQLDQKVYQLTNNLNIFLNDHTLTVGGSFERFDFDNSFNLGVYEPFEAFGAFGGNSRPYPGGTFGPGFDSVGDFLDFVNDGDMATILQYAQDTFDGNNANGTWALAETNVGQLGMYIQDEFFPTDNLKLTIGLRGDLPLYFDTAEKIQENLDRSCCYDPGIEYFDENNNSVFFDHTDLPEQKLLLSPRLGFNWDAMGDRSLQVRGGSGLFTGRFPFVWIGNQVANPNNFFYNMTAGDFQFPQVW